VRPDAGRRELAPWEAVLLLATNNIRSCRIEDVLSIGAPGSPKELGSSSWLG